MTGAPRLAPVTVADLDDEAIAQLRAYMGPRGEPILRGEKDMPRIMAFLMNHPRLGTQYLHFGDTLMLDPELDPRLRELMVLRVAWRAGCEYEWLQHVRVAQKLGFTADEIAAVGGLAEIDWAPLDGLVLRAVDEMFDRFRLSDATWDALATHLDRREIMELVFGVGAYLVLAMAFNIFEVELDPQLEGIDAPRPPAP